MAHAANLQMLVTALAYKYIFTGSITHADIPDHPFVESERRQIFFGAAAGIPTFYVRTDTPNRLLARMVKQTRNTRSSRRYAGYTRVCIADFQQTLIRLLKEDAPELIEMGKLHDTIRDLADRTDEDGRDSVASRLTRRICQAAGVSSPMALTGDEFNAAAETFYRERLKKEQTGQALDQWSDQVRQLDAMSAWRSGHFNPALFSVLKGEDAAAFIAAVRSEVIADVLPPAIIARLIHLMLLTLSHMKRQSEAAHPEV
jgi:hypothetical protein